MKLDKALGTLIKNDNIKTLAGVYENTGGLIDAETLAAKLGILFKKQLLTSADDLNMITDGIYSYYVEATFPLNMPSKFNRGVIIHISNIHAIQVIFGTDAGAQNIAYRGSYDNGGNWTKWKYVSFTE